MKAVYRKQTAYPDNPFIRALPPRMENYQLMEALEERPEITAAMRELPSEQRLSYASKVLETFVPLEYAPYVYDLIYQGIVSSYANKNSVDAIRQMMKLQKEGSSPVGRAYMTQAAGNSILGVPGIGKTSTITRILDTIPQVIEHEKYNGKPFFCKQINWLHIQCPNDCSVKACCIAIFAQIDKLLGTSYAPKGQAGRGQTVDAMIAQLSKLCLTHHIGVLIIDEIQNVVSANKKGVFDGRLIRFFVQLMNDTGISVLLVGTPEIGAFFDSQPHLARRTRGLRLAPMQYRPSFERLLDTLWEQQVTKLYEPLNERLKRLLFEICGGLPALLGQAICLAQQHAITTGAERLSEEVIRDTANLYQLRKPSEFSEGIAASEFVIGGEEAVNEISSKKSSKGRPKAFREEDDIIMLYSQAKDTDALLKMFRERGWVEENGQC